jgi:hypothetical protein
MTLQLKRATGIIHSQRMASIVPIVIGCIDYLAYGTFFTRAMFRPKKKRDVFFPARKAADERWGVVYRSIRSVSNLPVTFLLNSFLSKLAPLTTQISDSDAELNDKTESVM